MNIAALESICRAPGVERVRRLNNGVDARVIHELAAAVDISLADLAENLGLSERTLRNRAVQRRRLRALLSGDESELAFRVYRVLKRAQAVLEDEAAAASWMTTPQKALGERTPLSMLSRDVGAEEVLNVLDAVEHGVYL